MKLIKRESIKTEGSEGIKEQKNSNALKWVDYSHQRKPAMIQTPLRFACITFKAKRKDRDTQSTKDRNQSNNETRSS